MAQREFKCIYPQIQWVEQKPLDILNTTLDSCKEVLQKAEEMKGEISAIGITNQRETTIIWDKKTGKPLYNAIVWQDRRTSDFCNNLLDRGYEKDIVKRTGLIIDPYFSATKIKWILEMLKMLKKNPIVVSSHLER